MTGVDVASPDHTGLEPDAIGVTADTVIGMAASAPAASTGLTIAFLAAAVAYGSGPIIILTAIPMLVIANAYRRLNMWNAKCGASFEWVGRAINPYLGFETGWLMIAAYILGTISGVEVLAPTVLAAFGSSSSSTWGNVAIDTALALVMVAIAVIGIKITARTQIGMAVIEYAILVGFGIAGLVFVLGHGHGSYPVTRGWLSPTGVGGAGSPAAGFLIAVFMFTGWDGAIYVNEETTRRHTNPGKAVMIAVGLLAVIYTLATVGLQGVVSPAKLQTNAASALVYIAQAMGGNGWGKVMALSVALSAIASTGAGIVITARIVYRMASERTLPPVLATVSPPVRHAGRGHRGGRDVRHRDHLGVPAGHLGPDRVHRRGGRDRAAVLGVLYPHRAGHHRLLPAAHHRPAVGPGLAGRAAAGSDGVPRLDHRQVDAAGPGEPELVHPRHRRSSA